MTDVAPTAPTPPPPDVLTPEAQQPYESLMERMQREAAALGVSPESPASSPGRRGRGRPPGSKNKSTLAREGQVGVSRSGSSRLVTPPGRSPKPDDGLTPEQRREIKQRRRDELQEKIINDGNEQIMLMLVSLGVPSSLLYKPGMAPAEVQTLSKYTQLASSVTISPIQAGLYAKFATELEQTDIGQKVTGVTGDSKMPLILYGALSLAATVQYVKGLTQFAEKIKPYLEAHAAREAEMNITVTDTGQRVQA